jgi:prepilin-type N-terminal cleavage/methylation domain-containing protein
MDSFVMRRTMRTTKISATRSRGFSLLEMMAAVAIMTIVIAVAVKSMIMMQTRNFAETSKVDTADQTRDFVDQMVRDVHDVGYPPGRVINGNPTCVNNANISCGLITFTPTSLQYEGDLDGTGKVYEVFMQLVAPASGNCPCILQRGVIDKQSWLTSGTTPPYYTEVNGVLNSGNGAGTATYTVSLAGSGSYSSYSTADVFDAYDVNGIKYVNSTTGLYSCINDPVACSSIRSLQITANVAPTYMDQTTKMFPVYTITSKARLNN